MGLCGVLVTRLAWNLFEVVDAPGFFSFFWREELQGYVGKLYCFPLACVVVGKISKNFFWISLKISIGLCEGDLFFPHSPVADHLFRRNTLGSVGGFVPPLACKKFTFRGFFLIFRKDFQGLCGEAAKLSTPPESNFDQLFRRICGALWKEFVSPLACKKICSSGLLFFSFRKDNSKGILWEAAKLSTPPGSFLINFSSKKKKKRRNLGLLKTTKKGVLRLVSIPSG